MGVLMISGVYNCKQNRWQNGAALCHAKSGWTMSKSGWCKSDSRLHTYYQMRFYWENQVYKCRPWGTTEDTMVNGMVCSYCMYCSILLLQGTSSDTSDDNEIVIFTESYHHKKAASIYLHLNKGTQIPVTAGWQPHAHVVICPYFQQEHSWMRPLLLVPQGKHHPNLAVGIFFKKNR